MFEVSRNLKFLFITLNVLYIFAQVDGHFSKQTEALFDDELAPIKEIFDLIKDFGLEETENILHRRKLNIAPGVHYQKPLEPDCKRNVTQLITSKGYKCEEHTAETRDGYLLGLQRIASGKGSNDSRAWTVGADGTSRVKKVVMLQHGLLDASTTWVINRADNSLGFMLADAGFDVWLTNSRGNTYARANTKLNHLRKKFWEFSWDEMAQIDLPDTIDYILNATGAESLYYVGHSEGTLIAFTGFSFNKTLGSKIKRMFALAPISHEGHLKGPLHLLARPFTAFGYSALDLLHYYDVLPHGFISEQAGMRFCHVCPTCCEVLTFIVTGTDFLTFNQSRSDVYFSHFPDGTSLQNINHWAQMVEHGSCQMYDYGRRGNEKHYGQKKPPFYNLTELAVPVALYSGTRDWLADPKDVEKLRQDINHTIVVDKTLDRYDHLDFVWGSTAHARIYDEIIAQIKL